MRRIHPATRFRVTADASAAERAQQAPVIGVASEQELLAPALGRGQRRDQHPEQSDRQRREIESEGEFGCSERTFEAALALWRGEPWSEFGEDAPFVRNRLRLTELRDMAVEELLAARLARGHLGPTVARLAGGGRGSAVSRTPLGTVGAGAVSHRTAGAGAGRTPPSAGPARHRNRHRTGPRLRTLQQRMLTHDPDLAADCPPILLRAR
ncbi:hypothetical protein F5544_23190 [Nocardia arthritidis]|uniref:Bacterial transcriptional activator domain-containing protein n=1 Tax=Nocardia arthritidis TaxID=228602 RepID=A0A6G9YUY1_9NOCA|nr:hypothetical protein F5544_23190 [Nocardia arthritidis]